MSGDADPSHGMLHNDSQSYYINIDMNMPPVPALRQPNKDTKDALDQIASPGPGGDRSRRPFQLRAAAQEFVPKYVASSLKPDVPEFIPNLNSLPNQSFNNDQTQPNSLQNNGHTNEQTNDSFYLYYQPEIDPNLYPDFSRLSLDRPPHLEVAEEEANLSVIDQFKDVLFCVTSRPSIVDDAVYMNDFLKGFSEQIDNEKTLEQIVNLLVEQSTLEANFRYSGARICGIFITLGETISSIASFRKKLLSCLQQEFKKNDVEISRKSGFLMFVAELFFHLKTKDGERYLILRKAMFDSISQLLVSPDDGIIKAVCQVLKLSGSAIDDTAIVSVSKGMDYEQVYGTLQSLRYSQCPLNKTSHLLIDSVSNQHANNWGRGSTSSLQDSEKSFTEFPGVYQNQPVFYNQNHEITSVQAGYDPEYDLRGAAIWDTSGTSQFDGGMDPEMEEAYEQFLREQSFT